MSGENFVTQTEGGTTGGAPQSSGYNGTGGKSNAKMFLMGLGAFVVLAVVLSLAFGIYRVYAKAATDGFTLTVAKVLRLPALKASGETVLYADYVEDLQAIHVMRDYDKKNQGPNAELTEEEMSDQVLWRLLNNILLNQAAKTYGLKVEASDLSELKNQLLEKFKDEAAADAEVRLRYGWDLKTYEQKVMISYILQNKLDVAVQGDKRLLDDQYNTAAKVLQDIKNGADFAEMAKKYGGDGTAAAGGDLGWFAKGEMVPEFETAVFALKKGELAKDLVQTQYGYHIVQLTDKKTEKEKDDKGKMVNVEKARARHILFRAPDANQYLDKMAKSAEIHLYLNVHDPFATLIQ